MARPFGMATVAVLSTVARRVSYGLDIAQETGLLQGTVYTTLRRLERRNLVRGRWEDPEVAEAERRPRRRYYTLTAEGEKALEDARDHRRELASGGGREPLATGGAR